MIGDALSSTKRKKKRKQKKEKEQNKNKKEKKKRSSWLAGRLAVRPTASNFLSACVRKLSPRSEKTVRESGFLRLKGEYRVNIFKK